MTRILTLNCNGIRAAYRKGFFSWIENVNADVICLQEVRADHIILEQPHLQIPGYNAWHNCAEKKGYSGVSLFSKHSPPVVQTQTLHPVLDGEGRWIQMDFEQLSVVSLYLPSGSSGETAQIKKENVMTFLMDHLSACVRSGRSWVICGDLNIAHTEKDLKNWRANQKNSGFLPHERDWFSRLLQQGWTDIFRALNTQDHEYTWWSNRGNAWANNTGWRLDYQLACGPIARAPVKTGIYRLERFSDHAPLWVDYEISL